MNERWRHGDTAEIGERGSSEWKVVKVLAVADGYAMVRIPYCMPFVCAERELLPVESTIRRRRRRQRREAEASS